MPNGSQDQELLQIFIEEAIDLLSALSKTLSLWEQSLSDLNKIADLKRDLHTLKGSARMVGQSSIGTLAHELETFCETICLPKHVVTQHDFDRISLSIDRLDLMLEALQQKRTLPEIEDLISQLKAKDSKEKTNKLETDGKSGKDLAEKKSREEESSHHSDIIRIRASVLEKLNNLSSETSIARVGLEQHISDFGIYLMEMKQETKRLEGQLNTLSAEVQSYVMENKSGQRRTNGSNNLAVERFSSIDQFSHVIRETNFDIESILKNLLETQASMETLILNQSRVTAELQRRLAETRLVPFESIVPRLSRIARQVSHELNKEINFKVTKSEGEMDRILLEHLIPSLEHILCNAIDHGIEAKSIREKLGKPLQGKIEVCFTRTGSTIAIEIKDDGAGIDSELVRKKAIKLELLSEDHELSDEEILRFILQPGFSTKENVSLISGRGVGMDVVNTMVKELGGNLSIDSEKNQGTTITLRFPFTTSLNRILIFNVLDKTYGILLTSVDSVINESESVIEKLLDQDVPIYNNGLKDYHLHYLGNLIESEQAEIHVNSKKSFPLLLFSTPEHSLALIVDSVLYSRELVVQSLGAQFKLIDECSGATMLGDGRVVLILDPYTLSMKSKALREKGKVSITFLKEKAKKDNQRKPILVVDDSISVRAVTKKLLERNKYFVMTAKDGVDALQRLEEELPYLILLDLDMPRMDGFEFASMLRKDKRYEQIPIIVISSREAMMHQKIAEELKFNYFLKKPYQESDLMSAIQSIMGNIL